MIWTEQHVTKLCELAFAENSNTQIAEILHIPVEEVYAKRSSMGITVAKVREAKMGTESNISRTPVTPPKTTREKTPHLPQVGSITTSGHTIDAIYCVGTDRYALAHKDGAVESYVVWNIDQAGGFWGGQYFSTAERARRCFAQHILDGVTVPVQEERPVPEVQSAPFDIVSMVVSCKQPEKSEDQNKVDFCKLLLEQFAKMKGEELSPHLFEITFDRKDRCSHLHFRF